MSSAGDSSACAEAVLVSVIVPTRNEADNIAPLVARLDHALGEIRTEILFVDDSDDATPQRIEHEAATSRRIIRLLHRFPGERGGGLGGAVLAGLRAATGQWVVVMDGDLQHPPEAVPALVATGEREDADVVVASRRVPDGSAAGLSSAGRVAASAGATRLTRAVFPRRLRDCTDPMSGFFALRRERIMLDELRPNGFKILLEVLARHPGLRVREFPFVFGERHSGHSKASWREGWLLLRRLVELRCATIASTPSLRMMAFLAVGVSGLGVNSVALWFFVHAFHAPLLIAAALATQASTLWNFLLADWLVFRGHKSHRTWARLAGFAVLNNAVLLARLPLLSVLVHHAGMHYLFANLLTLLAAFALRYAVSDRVLFSRGVPMTATAVPTTTTSPEPADGGTQRSTGEAGRRLGPVDLVIDMASPAGPQVRRRPSTHPHGYDIHGIVTVASAVPLPELAPFAVTEPVVSPDIEICVGGFDGSRLRARSRVTQYALHPGVSYQEQLGRLGSDFYIEMSGSIRVVVGPMLRRSPHVLYTNVVEALLRFVLVSRGYMLLHSACLELDGHGLLLSALTDTGKTGTVLRLLRENHGRFLSDDMTILDADGMARAYPKPLTISQHTLRAVQAGDLSRAEWRRLRVQSRVHSKEGRNVGARLGRMNVPIMTMNAITQLVVPPPKYVVDRLVPCEHTSTVAVENLFIIERDEYRLSDIDGDALIDELIANTDDAYGFPPFRYFAPALVIGGSAYEELRASERQILTAAMSGVRARRLATPDFTWADHIPALALAPSEPAQLARRPESMQLAPRHPEPR